MEKVKYIVKNIQKEYTMFHIKEREVLIYEHST